MSISSNPNIYNTCLRILERKDFTIEVIGELDSDGCFPHDATWMAKKNEFKFVAANPIELLGLVSIHDYFQPVSDKPYWWKIDGPNAWTEIMERTFPVINEDSKDIKFKDLPKEG